MAKEYWQIIIFSATFGLSEGVFITTQNFILLTCVDKKRRTAAFCINNLLYAFTAAAGGPVAGKWINEPKEDGFKSLEIIS